MRNRQNSVVVTPQITGYGRWCPFTVSIFLSFCFSFGPEDIEKRDVYLWSVSTHADPPISNSCPAHESFRSPYKKKLKLRGFQGKIATEILPEIAYRSRSTYILTFSMPEPKSDLPNLLLVWVWVYGRLPYAATNVVSPSSSSSSVQPMQSVEYFA